MKRILAIALTLFVAGCAALNPCKPDGLSILCPFGGAKAAHASAPLTIEYSVPIIMLDGSVGTIPIHDDRPDLRRRVLICTKVSEDMARCVAEVDGKRTTVDVVKLKTKGKKI